MPDEQTDVVTFLSKPEAYGLKDATVERHATHGSFVFLAGDRAYKLKRAVRFPYMDYSTLARRKAMCDAELAVNRRLAPEIYIGTSAVVRTKDGSYRIAAPADDADIVDWLVVMRRFEQDALLEAMRRQGRLDVGLMRRLGKRIAAFHRNAERAEGGARNIAAVLEENAELLGRATAKPFDAGKVAQLVSLSRAAFERLAPLLDARNKDGKVRRCHGDLHLNNICVVEGEPVPFDAIEFSEAFACIDVLYDFAFLLMDLDRHGLSLEANALFNRYLEETGDYSGLAALPLFLSCRAAIRAHVVVSMATAGGAALGTDRAEEACALLDRAIAYLETNAALLVAIGGVSGTGKSTLAAKLAPKLGPRPGAVVVRSDVIRKQLWGVDEFARLPSEAYGPDVSLRVYDELMMRAGSVLDAGYCVIADAVFGHVADRVRIERVANSRQHGFTGLWLSAPVEVLERRIGGRHDDASDATVAVMRAQLASVEAPGDWLILDADRPDLDARAIAAIRA